MMTTPSRGAERRNVPCTISIPREDLVELEREAEESGSGLYGRRIGYADVVRKAIREHLEQRRTTRQLSMSDLAEPLRKRPSSKASKKARARR